jgi:hypothetical protein
MARNRFRRGLDEIYFVRRRDVIRFQGEARIRELLVQLGDEDPSQLAALLGEYRRPNDLDESAALDRLVGVFARGDLKLVRLEERSTLQTGPHVVPGRDDPRPLHPDRPVAPRPTWISLEIVDEAGRPLPGLGLAITLPDGTRRSGRVDETARYRIDDVPEEGTCVVTVAAVVDVELGQPTTSIPEGEWIGADGSDCVRVVTKRHHRLVVVAGRTEVQVVDAVGRPVKGVFWAATVAGRALHGTTDETGAYVLHHPRAVEACEIELTQLDGSTWDRQA